MTDSFGRYLAQQRELRAMSREEVAQATRISAAHLAALEEDRLADLPAEAFVVGYIRSYAGCIGLNVDDTVLRFQEQHPTAQPTPKAGPSLARFTTPALFLVGLAIGWLLARH